MAAAFVPFLLGLLANIRLMHWQTKSHARHVATDDLLKEMSGLVDTFVEAHMGRHGGFTVAQGALDLYDKADPAKYVKTVRDKLAAWTDLEADLQSVRDDMLVALNKTLFLFTLK